MFRQQCGESWALARLRAELFFNVFSLSKAKILRNCPHGFKFFQGCVGIGTPKFVFDLTLVSDLKWCRSPTTKNGYHSGLLG